MTGRVISISKGLCLVMTAYAVEANKRFSEKEMSKELETDWPIISDHLKNDYINCVMIG